MNLTEFRNQQKQLKNARRPQAPKKRRDVSLGERLLSKQLEALKIEYTTEFRFHPERKWRADFRINGYPILIEVEGGIWSQGRHTRGKGFEGDCEKYAEAIILGYSVLRFSTQQVKRGYAINIIERLLG